jgi:hypothetical protein
MRASITAAAALLLVACGGRDDAGNAQADGSEAAAGGAGEEAGVTMEAGEWETTVQVVDMSMPNLPAGVSMPTPPTTTVRSCLTPEQVRRPDADFFTGSQQSGCTYENMSMRNGRIQGSVQCDTGAGTMRSTFEGQFTPTSYEMTQRMQMAGEGAGAGMNMESRVTGRRIGDCPSG